LTARADELFELTEAVLCTEGPVRTLVELALAPEHRRGYGALYDALNHGHIEIGRLRCRLAGLALPRSAEGRIVLGVDVSPWLRPDAPTSADRLFCHTYGRGRGQAQMNPGWPYSVVAALEPGRTSWTAVLDAVRLGPDHDLTAVTAAQLRDLVNRLREAGQRKVNREYRVGLVARNCRQVGPDRSGAGSTPALFTSRMMWKVSSTRTASGSSVRNADA
jgi:DDE superfamily endonuclease